MTRVRTLAEFEEDLRGAVAGGLRSQVRLAAIRLSLVAEGLAKRNATQHVSPYRTEGLASGGLHRRSARLVNSIRSFARDASDGWADVVATADVKYAGTHEYGATIQARRAFASLPGGPFLAIPLDATKTRGGDVRGGLRDFPGMFLIRSRRGRWLLVRQQGARLVAMFALVKRVTIPPRPYLRPALAQVQAEHVARELGQALRTAIRHEEE
jgi:phage gpG-like protein